MFPRKAAKPIESHTDYDLIRQPVTTESAMHKIEKLNTLVFLVDMNATKPMIKKAFEKLYQVKVRKVNTLITFVHYSYLCFYLYLLFTDPRARRRLTSALTPKTRLSRLLTRLVLYKRFYHVIFSHSCSTRFTWLLK